MDEINEKKQIQINVNEEKIKKIKEEIFSKGKTPIHVCEKDGKIDWKNPIIKEGEGAFSDVVKKLTGTKDYDLAASVFDKGRNALPENNYTLAANMTLQVLADGEPKDVIEARLITQQAALYAQGMRYLSRAEGALDDDVFDKQGWNQIFIKNAMKLLRLHNETIEALGKYRRGGEQRVIVQHVNVEGGAQAIVNNGNMVAGGGMKEKINEVTPC